MAAMANKNKRPSRKKKSVAKPVSIILIAVGLAGGAALYFSRQPATAPSQAAANANAANQSAVSSARPSIQMPLGGGQFRGSSTAPITLVEFGDYQCPTCAAFSPIVND